MATAFVFAFGLAVGSFLNSVIYRLEKGGSLISERSHCPHCGQVLSWYELIPLVSFAVQLGRCRTCKRRISWQYPLVEFSCGLLFLTAYFYLPPYYYGWELAYLFFVFASLLAIFVFDLKRYIIPNRILYPLILLTLAHVWWGKGYLPGAYPVWSALGAAGFFLLLYLVSRGSWIGFGDVKFGVFMGLFLGFPLVLVAFFFSYVLGALIGGSLLVRKKASLKSQIPFGPFLITGTGIAYFWGTAIIQWYLNIF